MFLHLSLSVGHGLVQSLGLGQEDHTDEGPLSSHQMLTLDHQLAEIQTCFVFFIILEFSLASYLLSTSRKVVGLLSDLGKLLSSFYWWDLRGSEVISHRRASGSVCSVSDFSSALHTVHDLAWRTYLFAAQVLVLNLHDLRLEWSSTVGD